MKDDKREQGTRDEDLVSIGLVTYTATTKSESTVSKRTKEEERAMRLLDQL